MSSSTQETHQPLRTLGKAKRSYTSFPQIMWASVFLGLGTFNMMVVKLSFGLTLALYAIGIVGALPFSHEAPLFISVYKGYRHLILRIRNGVIYSRRLSETATFVRGAEGKERIKAPFDVALEGIPTLADGQGAAQFATLTTDDGRHSAMLCTGGWGAFAMSDPHDANSYLGGLLQIYLDTITAMKPGDMLTLFTNRRHAYTGEYATYVNQRVHEEVLLAEPSNTHAWTERQDMFDSAAEIYADGMEHNAGIVINVSRPTYWRRGKLDKLTPAQIKATPLVKLITGLSDRLRTAQLDEVQLPNLYGAARILKSIWSTGTTLDTYRSQVIDDEQRELNGKFKSFLDAKSLRAGPWPQQRVELHNNYMVMDGTHLAVLWATDFLSDYAHISTFRRLNHLDVPYTVSLSCTVLDRKRSKRGHMLRSDLAQTRLGLFRGSDLKQDPELVRQLRQAGQEWDQFAADASVELNMRLLVIVAGQSRDELEDNIGVLTNEMDSLRLMPQRISGETDQLYWFMAALGVQHS